MIDGNTLLDRGWPEGPMIGAALDVVTEFVKARLPDDHILKVLEDVRRKPDLYDDPEHAAQPLAKAVKAHRKKQRKKKQQEAVREQVRDAPLEAPIWGEDLIDPEAIQQLRDAMRLPATVAGALMPDAHIGYGIPIGGVVALDNAVAPYMVGVDIACFHGDTLVQTIDGHAYPIAELAKRREQFGVWTCTSEGKVEAGWASAHKTGTQKALIEIHLDNEEVIRCTPDHEFMLRDGTYRRADALTEGTSLMPFYYGIDSEGYFRVCQNDSERSGTQVGHWVVARAGLMGPIPSFEEQKTVIHHKDFDGTNNDPSNLEFMGDHDHSAYHRSLVKRNEYWQSEAFEEARKAALAAKAATPEGYAEFAARADRLNAYLAEHAEVREHINHQVSRNNRTSERREQSREIASRTYACGICGREIKSVIALNSHFRHKHAEDYSWDACYDGTPINHEVVAVRQTGERADVFCLQVPSHGNFALAAGVFVHNCRMMMSVYPAEMGLMLHDQGGREDLKRVMREETRFGLGASFAQGERRQHPVLDDPDWNATPLLRGLKDKAYAQLGTSGTGNHFVDAGLLDVSEAGADALGLPAGTYLALLTHSGSRGPGATIANHYSKLAKKHSKLPKSLQQLAYFDLDSELGQEYWLSMNLAGRFASACHHTMHEAFARRLGETPLTQVENHHNFCIAGDQIIPTPSGPKCMDEIRSGDVIYAFDEEQGVVPASVATAWCSGEKEIYEVSTQNRRIRCTGDHQLLAIEVTKQRREGCPGLRKRVGTFTWKKASQLRRGDILVCTDQYYGQDSAVGIATARLAGAFLGDGWIRQKNPHISGYSVGFAIGTEEDEHTKRYKQLVEAVLPSANWKNNAPGAFGLSCSSKAVHSDIRELELGATSAEARVPSYIYTAPFEEKIAFLSGYFDADGSVSGNEKNAGRGTIAATSRDLVYGLREVAIACGLQVTPVRHRRAQTNYGTMDVYRCVLAADAMMRLDLWHQQKRENQRATRYQRPQGLQASKRGYLDLPAGTFAQSVRSVTPTGQKEDVYDLTIDHPSHAFVCEGIVVHNCWKETWRDRTVYVHRKGATPAHEGVLGIIPGSQGHDSFIAQGKGNAASLNSASHGAGRVMSRTQAFKTIPRQARNRWLEERGIELLAGGMDEAPQAYKDIEEVLAVQDDLIATIARFRPKLVLMADDGKSEG